MPEMDDLIASLRERIRSRNAFENNSEEKVYSDEKIIFTADHLRSFRPPELREMRRIAQSCFMKLCGVSSFDKFLYE